MWKTFLSYLAAVVTGILIARFALPASADVAPTSTTPQSTHSTEYVENDFDPASLTMRLEETEEKYHAMQKELRQLKNNLATEPRRNDFVNDVGEQEPADVMAAVQDSIRERVQQNRRNNDPEFQREQLLNAGFNESELASIEQARADFSQQQLERRLQAMRDNPDAYTNILDPFGYQATREALGDQRFEEYLTTLGRPTSVQTREVIPGSAADQAGIQAGDQIYSYDGSRVFQAGDVTRGTISGNPGDNVIVEVLRDDAVIPLTVERGALGVNLSRGGRGGRGNR